MQPCSATLNADDPSSEHGKALTDSQHVGGVPMSGAVTSHAFHACTGVHDLQWCFHVLRSLASAKAGANRMQALLDFAASNGASMATAKLGEIPGRRCRRNKTGAGHTRASKSLNQI